MVHKFLWINHVDRVLFQAGFLKFLFSKLAQLNEEDRVLCVFDGDIEGE
jgi:hypothetical protein